MTEKLSESAVTDGIQSTQWRREGEAIVRDVELDDFRAALAYVNEVGATAEEANHHPDILIHGYNRVRLTLSTHSVGGLTQADLDMAGRLG